MSSCVGKVSERTINERLWRAKKYGTLDGKLDGTQNEFGITRSCVDNERVSQKSCSVSA